MCERLPVPGPDAIHAVVLAGGFGTRVQSVLGDLPKPMAPIAGRPFIEWLIRYLAGQGIQRVIVSTGYRAATVAQHVNSLALPGMRMECVPEARPQGTAGGFLNAVKSVDRSARPAAWLVVNGDTLVLTRLNALFDQLAEPEIGGAVLGVRVNDAARYGTLDRSAAGELIGFREKTPGAGMINAGVYLFRPALLERFPEIRPLSFEHHVFPALVGRGERLQVCTTDVPFLDIGTPESLALAASFVRAHATWFGLS